MKRVFPFLDGHYLNLPVLEDGAILGIVDVLKLTYVTLEQIHSIQGNDGEGGKKIYIYYFFIGFMG